VRRTWPRFGPSPTDCGPSAGTGPRPRSTASGAGSSGVGRRMGSAARRPFRGDRRCGTRPEGDTQLVTPLLRCHALLALRADTPRQPLALATGPVGAERRRPRDTAGAVSRVCEPSFDGASHPRKETAEKQPERAVRGRGGTAALVPPYLSSLLLHLDSPFSSGQNRRPGWLGFPIRQPTDWPTTPGETHDNRKPHRPEPEPPRHPGPPDPGHRRRADPGHGAVRHRRCRRRAGDPGHQPDRR
jgi:hypothetical protein